MFAINGPKMCYISQDTSSCVFANLLSIMTIVIHGQIVLPCQLGITSVRSYWKVRAVGGGGG